MYRLALALLGLSLSCGSASTPRWSRWAAVVSTQGDDIVGSVAVDALGNVYAAGKANGNGVFVQEYGSDGTLLLDKRWPSRRWRTRRR